MSDLGQQAGQDQILVSPGVWKSSLFPNAWLLEQAALSKPPPLPWHTARGLTVPSPPELSTQHRGCAPVPGKVQGREAAVNNRKGRAVTPWGPASPASCGQSRCQGRSSRRWGPAEPGLEGLGSTPELGKSGTNALKDRGTEGQSLLTLLLCPCSWKVLNAHSQPSWEMAEPLRGAGTETNPGLLLQPRGRCHGFTHFPKASRFLDVS